MDLKDRKPHEKWRYIMLALVVLMFATVAFGAKTSIDNTDLARQASVRNTRILTLVEQCVVEGDCGPAGGSDDSDTQLLIQRILAGLDCLAGEESPDSYHNCVEARMAARTRQP